MSLTRPGTLVQVLQLVGNGEKLGFCLAGFLDDFYGDTSKASRARRIAEEPGLTEDPRMNALFGAIGEHLATGLIMNWQRHGQIRSNRGWSHRFGVGSRAHRGDVVSRRPIQGTIRMAIVVG
jgi:hypothetical protein